jgi:hypothetical protein
MKWYIGQEIVCIKTHPEGLVKKGEIYVIQKLSQCKCCILIDVGVITNQGCQCQECNTIVSEYDNYFYESRFAPLEYNQDEINKLLENTLVEKI